MNSQVQNKKSQLPKAKHQRISGRLFKPIQLSGFGLIEIIVVSSLVTVVFFGILQAGIVALKLLRNEKENLEAALLAQEALEAVRSLRDESWTKLSILSNNTPYYPVVENNKWTLKSTPPPPLNGKYNRYVMFSDVFRDSQDKIASAGTLDSNTKQVTAYVASDSKIFQITTYLTNFQAYLTYPQEAKVISFENGTTDADFGQFPSDNAGDGDPVQSFTTSGAIQVTKVEFYLRRTTAAPSNVYLEIRSSPTGAILGTSNIINSSTISDSSLSWVEFRFYPAVQLNANTTYYLRLRSNPSSTDAGSGSQGLIHIGYQNIPGSPYSGGEARLYVGRLSNPNDEGQIQADYDFSFKIFDLQ